MITVTENKRYLNKDGKFYPYLADTAWTLLQRLDREEIAYYLDKRKSQGFNAIQVSAISELDGVRKPNREGQLPFIGEDVNKPNPYYFDLLRFLINECAERDMVLTLLPAWGDKFNKKWGIGPEIFTPENSRRYGSFLAELAGPHENIIFMLGGDRPIETETHRRIIDETAYGIREAESVRHLITYHPCGEATSLQFLKDCEYLDFHSLQSGHSFGGYKSEITVSEVLEAEQKPCLDVECFYEDFPIDFNRGWGYRLTAADIRKRIYRNMMAGALGTVYGHQSVWCFKEKADGEYLFDWKTALDRPMANEIGNINIFLNQVNITDMLHYEKCYNATAIADNRRAVVYSENNYPIFIRIPPDKKILRGRWFDTVSGKFIPSDLENTETLTAVSPLKNDGLLVIDFED